MDANVINELKNGLSAAYINGSLATNLAYKPAFVSNNPEEGKKVISSVEDELLRCDQFQIESMDSWIEYILDLSCKVFVI